MKIKAILSLVVVGMMGIVFTACVSNDKSSKLAAKIELEKMGVPYTDKAFIDNARKGDLKVLKLFLEAGEDINIHENDTPLTAAVRENNFNTVKFLIDNGADVNRPAYWETPIGVAAYNGYVKIAEILIKHGADVNVQAEDGVTPLVNAILTNKPEMVDLLLSNGANPNYVLPDTGESPIIIAARNGNTKMVDSLINDGANVNYLDSGSLTSLDWAMIRNHSDCAEILINKGALITENRSNRPMMIALFRKNFKIAQLLISKGANVNALAYNKMPLIVWCAKNSNDEAVEFLIKQGADVRLRDAAGQGAIDYAISNKDDMMIKLLKDRLVKYPPKK